MKGTDLIKDKSATALLADFKDITDPTYVGPGYWHVIHKKARNAKTPKDENEFINFMIDVSLTFPCSSCTTHCQQYIQSFPMTDYKGIKLNIAGEETVIGLFIWTWKFHNAVNKRLNKPIMSWDTALNLYSNNESLVCSKTCADAAADQPIQTPKPPSKLNPLPKFQLIKRSHS